MSPSENETRDTLPYEIGPETSDNSGPYYITAAQYYGGRTDWHSLSPYSRSQIVTAELFDQSVWSNGGNYYPNTGNNNLVGNSNIPGPEDDNFFANNSNNNIALPMTGNGNLNMRNTPLSSVSTAVSPAVGQGQGILPQGGPGLTPGAVASQQPPTTVVQPAVGTLPVRVPTPVNVPWTNGPRGDSRYYKTVARNISVPNLEAPGMACTDQACSCSKAAWPTSGDLTILSCGIVCEVCGLYRKDFGISASNLRRHVREHHLLTSTVRGSTGQPAPARLYNSVEPVRR